MKERVQHHSAAVLVVPHNYNRALLGLYDDTYPVEIFRGNYNFIGGNGCEDSSPKSLVTREAGRELTGKGSDDETVGQIIGSKKADVKVTDYLKDRKYAPKEIRDAARDAILANIQGHSDYLVRIEGKRIGKDTDLVYISSAFISFIERDLLECVYEELINGREITNEGLTRIVAPDELARGEIRGSWGYATIIENIIGWGAPEHSFINVDSLGSKPRNSFKDYKEQFEYNRDPEIDWRK